ncbi:MAG: hypothetical protein A3G21_19170 [Acidobacteria bacterium RIFCSPLOWO2_12_FULL_66_21]|nr:MAG: hypothetical protein A3G21_19170 [Acidobacteria bacterium RIFCSPLOWO2_12_FULL_66_21]
MRRMTLFLLIVAVSLLPSAASAQPAQTAETLATGEQKSLTPGYAIGDIAIGNSRVADFKVMAGRRELLLFGRADGQTTLTIWDQRRVKRHEITITVHPPIDPQIERDLKALLQDFPSVEVRTLAGAPVLAGAVSSKDDLAAVEKIAAAAKVRSLVRFVPPSPVGGGGTTATPTMPQPSTAAPPKPGPPTAGPPNVRLAGDPAAPVPAPVPVTKLDTGPQVEYEIELLEASSRFRSGSYATGVEPSGRRLYIGKMTTPIGADGEIFIGGKAVTGKDPKVKGGTQVEQGIRLTLRPQMPDKAGRFKTAILVQTNLPIGSDVYDPDTWRRARWEFNAVSGEPFGITGADLLAVAALPSGGGSAVGSVTQGASKASRIPGVSSLPGVSSVPVFGSLFGSSSYKQKQTQLLVIIRPRVVPPGGN